MTLMKDDNGFFEEGLFTDIEKRIFIIFLQHEKLRHLKDIEKINLDIESLRHQKLNEKEKEK